MGMFSEIEFKHNWKNANKLLEKYRKEISILLHKEYLSKYEEELFKCKDFSSYCISKEVVYLIGKYQGILELAETFDF